MASASNTEKEYSAPLFDLSSLPIDAVVGDALTALANDLSVEQTASVIRVIADVFGADGTFLLLLGTSNKNRQDVETQLLMRFQNNLNLLVQKTWVEQIDESLKAQVLLRLEQFCIEISEKKYAESYTSFLEMLNDTVYLMFGAQAREPSFVEYALRIDPEFGIFWVYMQTLSGKEMLSNEKSRLLLLLGMEFLAHY